jgi:hypothetical protein
MFAIAWHISLLSFTRDSLLYVSEFVELGELSYKDVCNISLSSAYYFLALVSVFITFCASNFLLTSLARAYSCLINFLLAIL